MDSISRRTVVAMGVALFGAPRAVAADKLAFAAFRNGVRVGEHEMSFSGAADDVAVAFVDRLGKSNYFACFFYQFFRDDS